MKPAIASMLISLFTKPGEYVLDPFSGAGTVPFEACLQGRVGLAGDLSPLAFCLSSAKVAPPSLAQVLKRLTELEEAITALRPCVESTVVEPEIPDFYHPATLAEILAAKQYFDAREKDGAADSSHWFLKSCTLHILHGNRPYALSRRSHGIIPIPPKGPTIYKSLMVSLRAKALRMALERPVPDFRDGKAFQASANAFPLEDHSVDCIITSPPFLGTTEFLRQNRIRLWFCGWNYAQQTQSKPDFLEYSKSMNPYNAVLTEFRRVLTNKGLAVMHLGVVKKLDMASAVEAIAPAYGFETLATLYEDATGLESHGRTDRGATHQHQFLFLRPTS